MSRVRTLAEMIADVRQRTNMETSTFVTDDEITEYINQELAELWARIAQGSGAPHYRAEKQYDVTTDETLYELPDDFWQVQHVEAIIDGCSYTIRNFMPMERAGLTNKVRYPYQSAMRYRVQADNIEFQPVVAPFTATLFYTPSCPRLVDVGDTFDGFNGYEMAAIYGACATVKDKEETDPSFYVGQKERIYRLIDALASQRDASEPERVQDVMPSVIGDVFGGEGWIP